MLNEEAIKIFLNGKEISFFSECNIYSFDVSFPKGKVNPEIRQWSICESSLDLGLKQNFYNGFDGEKITFPILNELLDVKNISNYKQGFDSQELSLPATFLGVYIENLLNEKYPISLKITIQGRVKQIEINQIDKLVTSSIPDFHISECQKTIFQNKYNEIWLFSEFDIPFIQRYIPPDYYHHNFIMLNFIKPEQIKEIHAWINGLEVMVSRYDYWRGGSGSFTYYIDGTKSSFQSGKNRIVLWVSSK